MKTFKRIIIAFIVCIALLFTVLIVNTVTITSKQLEVTAVPSIVLDQQKALENLAGAIRIPTISHQNKELIEYQNFTKLHHFLGETFPLVAENLSKEVVHNYSLLYKWQGKNLSLKPFLLMAHMDIVPVPDQDKWQQPPFSGKVHEGYIWGRGTMDDKGMVISILQAVELLLSEGFSPERTVYLSFGHDEETGGEDGTKKIVEHLQKQNIELEYVLDEGLVITQQIVPNIDKPVALVGIAEKGSLSLELSVTSDGGHSSMPPEKTAIGILSTAIERIQTNPIPTHIEQTMAMFTYLAPEMPFIKRMAIGNMWLFSSIVEAQLTQSPPTNATIRTTIAPTIFQAGTKENVLPANAKAILNFRILPGDTIAYVKEYITRVIADERVTINTFPQDYCEASPISDINHLSFRTIQKTVQQIFPDTLVAPSLMIGQTDARHFIPIAKNIYRFAPIMVNSEDTKRFHGSNERISTENYMKCIHFFHQLIKNSQ